ncbi:hypothetical protein VH86_06770 [Pantoea sp. BL1]|nr:hypothetical protein VH86_06770 [Pantoea sp. BL1]
MRLAVRVGQDGLTRTVRRHDVEAEGTASAARGRPLQPQRCQGQHISTSAHQHISTSAHQHISTSAHQYISIFAKQNAATFDSGSICE